MFTTAVCLAVLSFKGAAQPHASAYGLSVNTVLAVVAVESSGNPSAIRYEPHYYGAYMASLPHFRAAAARYGVRSVSSSLGLMQTMYATAYNEGYRGTPLGLLRAGNSLKYGSKHLGGLKRRYGEWNALRAYNAGVGGMLAGRGGSYASKVWQWKSRIEKGCR
ncbi:transglycosylase SLT domain-containing protein [Deinococcus sp. 6YEL10]|uniref:transglycosylase SLT domain-containing protein n=1 Tax=Deinococcus sp. 6YEL10 TaxID=2745870 RepID=UPI001E39737F|nr:transglycosylase SLT domain-containing protein [Deinococcus sp. 6YEL10]MCD0159807.1 transglycosylase SLT domain-containing protein [Deinococcus sp. 6YEL10]